MSRYSNVDRQHAIARATEVGPTAAAEELGVNVNTLKSWMKRTGDAVEVVAAMVAASTDEPARAEVVPLSESMAALAAARGRPWSERAPLIVDALGDVITNAVIAAGVEAASGRGRNAKDLVTAAAIALDKSLLLSGKPTRRTESHSTSTHVEHRRITVETDAELRAKVESLRLDLGMPALGPIVDAEVVEEVGDDAGA